MLVDPKFAELEAVDAYAIAINLAYLNLPNLRFADRIKARIRSVVRSFDSDQYENALINDPAYRSVYEAGGLDEVRGVKSPVTKSKSDGDMRTRAFMIGWCTPVLLGNNSHLPIDKVIVSFLLTISSMYMYVIVAARLGSDPTDVEALAKLMVVFVVIPAVGLLVYFFSAKDWTSVGLVALPSLYFLYAFYNPGGLLAYPVAQPKWAMLLLASSVGLTTMFVLMSFGLYRHAEEHYVAETHRVFNAQRRADL